jgi:beta-glucosidase
MKFAALSFLLFLGINAQSTNDTSKASLTWDQAYRKANELVKQMSLEQKVGIMTGNGLLRGPCVGNTAKVDGLFPSLCLQDGPMGVSGQLTMPKKENVCIFKPRFFRYVELQA